MYGKFNVDPDAPVRRAWATLHPRSSGSATLGAGVVVADGYLLTCAHVINAALGRERLASNEPTPAEMVGVAVSFPSTGSERHPVQLTHWLPPKIEGTQWWEGDLALLRVALPGTGIGPVAIRETSARKLSTWYANAAPRSLVDVVVQASMGPWYILDPGVAPLEIQPGHSGAPLWDRERGCVAGLLVSTEPGNPRSYAIRAPQLLRLLAAAGVLPSARVDSLSPRERARRRELIDALDGLSDEKLARCAERFGDALGLPRRGLTREELVDQAADHARGFATLLSVLPGHDDAVRRVRAAAARVGSPRILAPDEYAELAALLGTAAHQELYEAARRAVPHLSLTTTNGADCDAADLAALIEDLEDRQLESGIVPPLLQAIEEVAAGRPENGEDLRSWSERVASRLGVSQGAMAQCRWTSRSRATARASPPILRVWLWPGAVVDSFHYVIRLYDGQGELAEVWTDMDTLRSRAELCADLSSAINGLDRYEDSAGIEFLLEEGSFGLAVDRLQTQAGVLGPRLLGLDRVVVLRGQRVFRAGEWRARWQRRQNPGSGPHVVHDQESADSTLTNKREIACVIAACPPEQRERTLALCRWFGVPVVLWHRDAHGPQAADALLPVVREDWPTSLREEVRRCRAEARHDTAHVGAHLALLWEDPSWTPPQPRLSTPTISEGGAA
ncbi:hypothetical protein SSP531S_02650 [Streptomyces spongiicola]|uniref:vWA-MoxR associated protein C-terminal domain-containing protein n=1 Tax=Streptomyces spongiicola TaxID=1690221 RepID=A0A388SQG2_9ACTN|nr:hypothetical protein SSP531S_02650 [Streptomyces spongiicola]